MANITLVIPDAVIPRVVAALCAAAGLTPANAGNAKQALINHIKSTVVNYERGQAMVAAQAAIVEPTEPEVT